MNLTDNIPEEELKEIAFQSLLLSADPVMMTNESGIIKWHNEAVTDLLGYSENDLKLIKIWDIFDNVTEGSWQEFWKEFENKSAFSLETTHTRKNGEKIIVHLTIKKIDNNERILFSKSHDITDVVKAEEALSLSEKRYETFINNYQGIAYVAGTDWIPRLFKGDVVGITGYTEEELMSGNPSWNKVIHPDDFGWLSEGARELKKYPNTKKEGEYRIFKKNGTIAWVRDTIQNVCDEKGEPYLLVGSMIDITGQKFTEEALRKTNQKLNMLTSIIRHDILNYLMACQSYIQLMEMKTDDKILIDFLQNMDVSAKSIGKLIQFTKEYQSLGIEEPRWQNVKTIVDKVKNEPLFRNIDFVDSHEPVEVFSDILIERVFFNLFENSFRHGIHVSRIVISSYEKDGQYILIVEDDGIGIEAEDKEKIFNEHFGKNTGLGLFFVREILSITGIGIHETGTPGKGAKFEILIPEGYWRKI